MPSDDDLLFDEIRDKFAKQSKTGPKPRIEDFLDGWNEPQKSELRTRLCSVEKELTDQSSLHGTKVGRYVIKSLLGEGGMGKVYRAYDPQTDRDVALKVLQSRYAEDSAWVARFRREARLLANLNHPSIATLYDHGEDSGKWFLAMELLEGTPLNVKLERGALPVPEALGVCRRIAEALEYAHARGVIHRDLKPGNVMLDRQAKVLDFGLGKNVKPSSRASSTQTTGAYHPVTAQGTTMGTPAYMSPEQARGEQPTGEAEEYSFGKRGDVWAFGCVLYECLAGRRAFRGRSRTDVLAAVTRDAPDWRFLPGLPPRLDALLRKCLEKDPLRRRQDFGDIRREIEEIEEELASPPLLKTNESEKQTFPAPPVPRSRWWLAGPALVAGFVAGAALSLLRPAPISEPALSSPVSWKGQRLLGGTTRAFGPRVSPNNEWLAFTVLDKSQAQVGLMKLGSQGWTVRTSERKTGGLLGGMCWSRHHNLLYFDRFLDVPKGIFSVIPFPAAAEEEREIEDAEAPCVASDGSLVYCKLDENGKYRLYCLAAEKAVNQEKMLTGPIEFLYFGFPKPVRALHKVLDVVFHGKLLKDGETPRSRFYRLDLMSGACTPLFETDVPIDPERLAPIGVQFALSRDDAFLYTVLPAGDAYQLVRIPLGQREARPEPLVLLTHLAFGLDVDGNGTVFLDQFQRPLEALRFDESGKSVERLATSAWGREMMTAELPDGRVLLPGLVEGREQLLVGGANKEDPSPLIPRRETAAPAQYLANGKLVLIVGEGEERRLYLAKLENNKQAKLLYPIADVSGKELRGISASGNGDAIYYVRQGKIWQIAVGGGLQKPKLITDGDGVAAHPANDKLLIQRFKNAGVSYSLRAQEDGKEEEIRATLPEGYRLSPYWLFGRSIDENGRALVSVSSTKTWDWRVAILHLEGEKKGKVEPIEVDFVGDTYPANWSIAKKGMITAMCYSYRGELWKLEAFKEGRPASFGP